MEAYCPMASHRLLPRHCQPMDSMRDLLETQGRSANNSTTAVLQRQNLTLVKVVFQTATPLFMDLQYDRPYMNSCCEFCRTLDRQMALVIVLQKQISISCEAHPHIVNSLSRHSLHGQATP